MRILLTGANGMVGRNLLENEKAADHEWILATRSEVNLLDGNDTEAFFKKAKPDVVIHAAGRVGGIQANVAEPVRFLVENTDMGRNVILAAFRAGVRKVLNLGSSCIYPRNRANPLTEEMLLTGELEPTNEGYALGKIYAIRLCQYLNRENLGLQYKTLLPCNLYGRWDHYDSERAHLVAAVISRIHAALRSGAPTLTVWGTGSVRREFMYAADAADAMLWALDKFDVIPDLLNVGIGEDYTVREYYDCIADVLGYRGEYVFDVGRPEGMTRKLLDVSKIRALGWKPKTSLRKGIECSCHFYQDRAGLSTARQERLACR